MNEYIVIKIGTQVIDLKHKSKYIKNKNTLRKFHSKVKFELFGIFL